MSNSFIYTVHYKGSKRECKLPNCNWKIRMFTGIPLSKRICTRGLYLFRGKHEWERLFDFHNRKTTW
jgi:hypothetical protein